MAKSGNVVPTVTKAEHIGPDDTGDNIEAKRVALYGYDAVAGTWARASATFGKLVPEKYDYIAATYPDTVTEVYTYKTGGSSGTTVATVTVIYTSSTKAVLTSVART